MAQVDEQTLSSVPPPPFRPREPDADECCGRGCEPCVLDLYDRKYQRWQDRVEEWRDSTGLDDDTNDAILATYISRWDEDDRIRKQKQREKAIKVEEEGQKQMMEEEKIKTATAATETTATAETTIPTSSIIGTNTMITETPAQTGESSTSTSTSASASTSTAASTSKSTSKSTARTYCDNCDCGRAPIYVSTSTSTPPQRQSQSIITTSSSIPMTTSASAVSNISTSSSPSLITSPKPTPPVIRARISIVDSNIDKYNTTSSSSCTSSIACPTEAATQPHFNSSHSSSLTHTHTLAFLLHACFFILSTFLLHWLPSLPYYSCLVISSFITYSIHPTLPQYAEQLSIRIHAVINQLQVGTSTGSVWTDGDGRNQLHPKIT